MVPGDVSFAEFAKKLEEMGEDMDQIQAVLDERHEQEQRAAALRARRTTDGRQMELPYQRLGVGDDVAGERMRQMMEQDGRGRKRKALGKSEYVEGEAELSDDDYVPGEDEPDEDDPVALAELQKELLADGPEVESRRAAERAARKRAAEGRMEDEFVETELKRALVDRPLEAGPDMNKLKLASAAELSVLPRVQDADGEDGDEDGEDGEGGRRTSRRHRKRRKKEKQVMEETIAPGILRSTSVLPQLKRDRKQPKPWELRLMRVSVVRESLP